MIYGEVRDISKRAVYDQIFSVTFRATDVFPVRHLNFSCTEESIRFTPAHGEATYTSFQYYADVSYAVVFSLCFALPPFLVRKVWLANEILLFKNFVQMTRACGVAPGMTKSEVSLTY